MNTIPFAPYQRIHLVGIKGVAMTSLAQCLIDLGKNVTGSDVMEDFVTKDILNELPITILPFSHHDCHLSAQLVIYTSAHGGPHHPEVVAARTAGIPTLSQAEALAELFDCKTGVAVCGVGGKSTTSAMVTWILHTLDQQPSFSVGVGKIIGMDRTGRWNDEGEVFVAEADEYVIDPSAVTKTPRFSFLHPSIIICTNLAYDHPDVYPSLQDTIHAFHAFFHNIKPGGTLIYNADDAQLSALVEQVQTERPDIASVPFGISRGRYQVQDYHIEAGSSHSTLVDTQSDSTQPLQLQLPGLYQHQNAAAAIAACMTLGISSQTACAALATFSSTQRRFEFIGEKNGVLYYDDYAHHPSEVGLLLQALNDFFPDRRVVIIFQPHTFSRTKQLFTEFVEVFSHAQTVVFLNIFASAREEFDPTISSSDLAAAVKQRNPDAWVDTAPTIDDAVAWCRQHVQPGDVCVTVGAGDVYTIHERIAS